MLLTLIILQIVVSVVMCIVILLQKDSKGDALGGLAGGGQSVLSSRASATIMTKFIYILATVFICNSLLMATITARTSKYNNSKSIVDEISVDAKENSDSKKEDESLKKDIKPLVPIAN